MEWAQPIITILSLIVAVVVGVNKIRWSKEYTDAKNETIKAKEAWIQAKDTVIQAKDAHIQVVEREVVSLKEFSSEKLREHFLNIKVSLEECIDTLQKQLEQSQSDIATKDREITELSAAGTRFQSDIDRVSAEKIDLELKVGNWEDQVTKLKPVYDDLVTVSGAYSTFSDRYPNFPWTAQSIRELAQKLGLPTDTEDIGLKGILKKVDFNEISKLLSKDKPADK
jgi:hypothetical protein